MGVLLRVMCLMYRRYRDVPARLITNNEALKSQENNAAIKFLKSMSPFFQYYENGKLKEVHFEDARSIEEKVNLDIDYNLGGLSYWTVMSFFKPMVGYRKF